MIHATFMLFLQLRLIIEALQNLLFLLLDAENEATSPNQSEAMCHHNKPQTQCPHKSHLFPCPTADDICYLMVRIKTDFVNAFLVESGIALHLLVCY